MKNWEDSIKDRLEGYESPLPEGSLAEFRALREGKAAAPARKLAPWIWGLTAAAAAGLAAVLFLRQPSVPDEGIQRIQQPAAPVAVVTDSAPAAEALPSTQLIAQAVVPKAVPQVTVRTRKTIQPAESAEPAEPTVAAEFAEPAEAAETAEAVPAAAPDEESAQPVFAKEESSPYIPERTVNRPVTMKVGPAAGIVAGSGLLVGLVMPFLGAGSSTMPSPTAHPYQDNSYLGYSSIIIDDSAVDEKHYFPLKVELTTRIPVANRLYVTTGLEYSFYGSSIFFAIAGEKKQTAHYMGIPIRADWLIASGKVLDVYAGAGVQGDLCVAATFDGNKIQRDGASLSLLGAGGIQLNMTRHLGLYVEPQLSWTLPSENLTLETYRSAHPLMFSMAAGLRINLDK
ncbi:MAG: hypothetical protein J5478_06225 [Bacteroidales bacterium]|nr:hypothetical protein [Bacteroidales bacterium]